MRRCNWTNGTTIGRILGAGSLLLLPSPVAADASDAAAWDDRHMQSNHAQEWSTLPARPILIGTASSTTTIGVAEQVLTVSPHGWQPGGPRSFASTRTRSVPASDFSRPTFTGGMRNSVRDAATRSQRHFRSR